MRIALPSELKEVTEAFWDNFCYIKCGLFILLDFSSYQLFVPLYDTETLTDSEISTVTSVISLTVDWSFVGEGKYRRGCGNLEIRGYCFSRYYY